MCGNRGIIIKKKNGPGFEGCVFKLKKNRKGNHLLVALLKIASES